MNQALLHGSVANTAVPNISPPPTPNPQTKEFKNKTAKRTVTSTLLSLLFRRARIVCVQRKVREDHQKFAQRSISKEDMDTFG